ncbi:MAG: neutral/alkaline non-lysosomal ceramidase N-terminal domain-containing protein [Prolixibacteraceae bacterium]|nr:neutral/alkaline non-lysosomal ceramidase N-terminal domain-containing protein [Prolixibacteraceae bacterium]
MKKRAITGMLFFLISLFTGWVSARGNAKSDNVVKMGAAQVNITPDKPAMMSGYAARETPSVGVRDSLYASAFYFSGDKGKSLLVTADLIGFSFDLTEEIRGLISSKTGIPSSNIMLVAVHNHGGPSVGYHGPESVREYTEVLKNKLVDLAVNASKNPQPFRMGLGKGQCALNINRRAEFSKGEVWLGRNQEGPCDRELAVIKFETLDQKPIAVLINWPCHGTATGDSNYLITGDWPGAAARYVKNQMDENLVVGVTAGASGDINPIYGPGNVFREVDAIGYHVGDEAARVLNETVTYPVKTLQTTEVMVTFPGKKNSPSHFPQPSYEAGPDTKIRLAAMKIGNLVLAGISGELFTEIGMEIKKQSPYSNTVILTHCNGSSGYICSDSEYPKGGYEVKVTRLMPGSEKNLVQSYINLIHSFEN